MLRYIKVKNVLSFKELTEINFESSNYGNKKDNVFSIKNNTFAKSMVIYGANASGKTNILKAMQFIKKVATYVESSSDKGLFVKPFLLDVESQKEPSFFEINFFVDKKEYIYNFEILDGKIIKENLIYISWTKKEFLFKRKKQDIKYSESFKKEAKKWLWKAKENVSFLAVLSQWNWELNKKPIDYFFNKVNIILDWDIPSHHFTTSLLNLENSKENKDIAIKFLKSADINIEDIKIERESFWDDILSKIERDFKDKWLIKELKNNWIIIVSFWHKVSWTKELEYFNLWNESGWTQKLFNFLWPIIDSIVNEKILFVDEIESNLHPHILKNIFKLIHSNMGKKYQFIFTTHNLELMDLSIFKKEQIWITDKNKASNTEFYTLYDFDGIRSENDIKKLYDLWSLWGVPITEDFSNLVSKFTLHETKEK